MLLFVTGHSPVAQLVEQLAVNQWVFGSSPNGGAYKTLQDKDLHDS